ncbi:helix-turn-helix domain-containing protein [Flavimarina sp. Hel_I_48]|uniref:helix-turn-helix domain-containing protein n=1 Tax=Flavimarina sp. Hel_I_48 TaxID=1392488 RepID=UPI0004DF4D81|nr:AraC family transcriptional regulator [Flavimarina sp. Hel_I_48]
MLHININDSNPFVEFLEAFQKVLGGELKMFDNEQLLSVFNKKAQGHLKCVPCNGGVGLIEFDISFKEDLCLDINTSELNFLYFIYSLDGQFKVESRADNDDKIFIKKFESVIISLERPSGNRIYFEAGQKLNLTIIALNGQLYRERHKITIKNKDPLNELFASGKENPIAFLGNCDLKIAEFVKELQAITADGLIRKILIENKINEILALHLQHFLDYGNSEKLIDLSKGELTKAMDISDYIKEQPVQPHSIDSLSAKSGLSPAKLQKSFKYLYGYTVSDYVRHLRLLKSEDLIKTTDLSISEIVYAVGFNSRSYFSKIFKEKYQYSPKQYQKLFRVTTV